MPRVKVKHPAAAAAAPRAGPTASDVNLAQGYCANDGQAVLDARTSQRIISLAQEELRSLQQAQAGKPPADQAGDDQSGDDQSAGPPFEPFEEIEAEMGVTAEDLSADPEARSLFANIGLLLQSRKTLGDAILEDVKQQEAQQRTSSSSSPSISSPSKSDLPQALVDLFLQLAEFMRRYRSGPLPKALRFVPRWQGWEELLLMTRPDEWSPAAMREMTAVFVNASKPLCLRFFTLVLLPAVRAEIVRNKKLRVGFFDALKKGLYKPDIWLKGVFFPLLADGCSMREAVIVGAVLNRTSIPPLFVAATIIKLCNSYSVQRAGWSPAVAYLIGILCNKQTSLPASAVSAIVNYFEGFVQLGSETSLPVVWHSALLIFVQRYKIHLSAEQRKKLRGVLKVHRHESIRAEVLRELAFVEMG